jgi:hypothetical protein
VSDEADLARENVIALEVKKDGLQQRQSGDWMLRLVAQHIDMHQIIINAPMGTRFHCTLIELDDDETPVDHKAIERDKWRTLGPVKQAGIRCNDPVFWAYLHERGWSQPTCAEEAAIIVRGICGVTSRSELGKPGRQEERTAWYKLDDKFQAWKARDG